MAIKSKKVTKGGVSKKRKNKKKRKVTHTRKSKEKLSSVRQAKVTKSREELDVLRTRFAATISGGAAGACFFKDPSGGPDQCIPATQDDCKSEGGVWTPGNCPS